MQGDADFICNWLGNLAWTEALEWPGQAAYNAAPIANLTLSRDIYNPSTSASGGQTAKDAKAGDVVGAFKSRGNFTYVKLHAGGHMVPYDQPRASLDMLNRWLGGQWWEGADKEGKKVSRKG
jgi:cathepsin A (carboxypeptidase C)